MCIEKMTNMRSGRVTHTPMKMLVMKLWRNAIGQEIQQAEKVVVKNRMDERTNGQGVSRSRLAREEQALFCLLSHQILGEVASNTKVR